MNKENNKDHLLFGGIVFGAVATVCFYFVITRGSQIELERAGGTLLKDSILWLSEWSIIIIGITIPWLVWRYLIKPYR